MTRYLALALAWALAAPAPADFSIRGFTPEAAKAQRALEEKARDVPDPAQLRAYMQKMAADPHIAGSPQSKAVAEYAAGLMKEWGLDVQIEEFEALLPYPKTRVLEMVAPVKFRAKLKEPAIPEDSDSGDKGQIPTYNAYSATGDVTGRLVYVNYGVPEDYDELKKLGIDVKGSIVIARYGRSWRGTKAKVAQERGAAGCLIYSDPRDDGYFQGDPYPKGALRPPDGVQRGSVLDMPLHTGDPLSPGWASEKGAKKLDRSEAEGLMQIPVLPISYADAEPLLAKLEGPVAPEAWRGALPLTYHIGPGPATVRLKVDFDWTTKPMYNVIARIPGSAWPDEWVIYGNHHDAWVNGAHDPVSGAGVVLETGRVLSELLKSGWRPKRTIKLALWDGEEFGLLGSTEWVEKHRDELARKAVVYFNTDTNGKGLLNAGGSPSLQMFFSQVLRDVPQPGKNGSVLENRPEREGKPQPFQLAPVGAGSDYVAFIHHTGIPVINSGFSSGEGAGVYHSIYDTYDWYTKFSDGSFTHGRALAQVMSTAVLRLAEAPVLPFEFTAPVRAIEDWMKDLPKADISDLRSAVDRLRSAADRYEERFKKGRTSPQVNAALIQTERALLLERGLPGRPWYKHQLMAPGLYTGYSAKTLPAIRDSRDPQAGVALVSEAVNAYAKAIEEAAKLLDTVK